MNDSPSASAVRRRAVVAAGAVASAVAVAATSTITAGVADAAPNARQVLESVGVPPDVAALADAGGLDVHTVDLLPETITDFSGSLGAPTTVSNALLSTVGGCQTDNRDAIVACTESQTLTTDAPLFLRTNPDETTIVVLGAGLFPDGTMRPVLEHRLQAALTLARDYPTAPIVVTGGVPRSGVTEADAMFDWLVAHGVAAERITKEDKSTSTVENARFTDTILDQRDAPAAVVVTSPGHLQRALVDFRSAVAGERPIEGVVAP